MQQKFTDRHAAGKALAAQLGQIVKAPYPLVLGLPRGGVPVAREIALALHGELDVLVVRKLGIPHFPEVAMGAIASGNARVVNQQIVDFYRVTAEDFQKVEKREQQELQRREQAYRDGRALPDVTDRTVIVVDDGIATGATMEAAVLALRTLNPARLIIAVPVSSTDGSTRLRYQADRFVCLQTPAEFYAVGQWYHDFPQTTDEEVRQLLAASAKRKTP
ncbi:MAG: phosphoribosyltransferase [Alcanivorax sp.]|nr:phosphoribosyltransferase [Alcanivorax sp.]